MRIPAFDVHYSRVFTGPDLFAIPDFAVGAMENWGLITYRETALLYNEATNPATSKQRVAVVIAHELAHQVITGENSQSGPSPRQSRRSVVPWFYWFALYHVV